MGVFLEHCPAHSVEGARSSRPGKDRPDCRGGSDFFCGRRGIYKFGASDESKQEARANNLVMWEGIRWLREHGSEELDFGRTSMSNEGLRRFKAGWGSQESVLEYVKYDLKRACFQVDKDRASGLHNEIFCRMPIALLR